MYDTSARRTGVQGAARRSPRKKEGGLTEPEVVGHPAIAWLVLVGLHRFPDVPAAELVDGLARGVLDLVPLDEGDARILDEARDVEDLAEADAGGVAADVGGDEDGDDGDAAGDVS